MPVLNPPPAFGTAAILAHGEETYGRFCGTCHGSDGLSRGMFPDLRYSGALGSGEAFKAIVLDGLLKANGMVSFAAAIKAEDAEAIRAYLVAKSIDAKNNPPPAPPAGAAPPPPPAPAPHAG
jgi:mono/diheme cytochrome c family protein